MGSIKGGGSVTVGYRYYMSLQMGLCRGPLDEIEQINVGDVRAWPVPDGDSQSESGLMVIATGPSGYGSHNTRMAVPLSQPPRRSTR